MKGSRPFYWFQGPEIQTLIERLQAAGPDARLEVHLEGHDATLEVYPEPTGEWPPLDNSHICPPQCP